MLSKPPSRTTGESMIQVTQAASSWIREQLYLRGRGKGIRLGIAPAGCTGYKYVIEFVDEENEEDYYTDQKGVRFFIDPKSRPALLDSVVEFRTEGLNSGLDIINPNTRDKCGCGESFSI
jgi:iron-sulfur cluster assembly protein